MAYELRLVETNDDWESWHAIRERVLWEARGEFGIYDRAHPSIRAPNHFPFLLLHNHVPVGAIAVEVEESDAWLRRVAIVEEKQRRGHGRVMLELAFQEARQRGCTFARSNVATDAVGFYEKLGFVVTKGLAGDGPEMSRAL